MHVGLSVAESPKVDERDPAARRGRRSRVPFSVGGVSSIQSAATLDTAIQQPRHPIQFLSTLPAGSRPSCRRVASSDTRCAAASTATIESCRAFTRSTASGAGYTMGRTISRGILGIFGIK